MDQHQPAVRPLLLAGLLAAILLPAALVFAGRRLLPAEGSAAPGPRVAFSCGTGAPLTPAPSGTLADFAPANGVPGDPFTVRFTAADADGVRQDDPIEVLWDFDAQMLTGERAGTGTLTGGQTSASIDANVPLDATTGRHMVTVCWQTHLVTGGIVWYYFFIDTSFVVSGGATPTPTPAPSPTPPPPTPTPHVPPFAYLPYNRPFADYLAPFLNFEDFSIFGVEFTEAIQCFDTSQGLSGCPDNSLPLVNQKDAAARIYIKYSGQAFSKAGIPVRLHLFAAGKEYIVDTAGTAYKTIRRDASDIASVWFNVNFTNDVDVSYYAEVDPNNIYPELNENNNRFPATGTNTITFQKRRTFSVVGWRMRYHPPGFNGNQYAGGWAVDTGGAQWLNLVWPVKEGGINYRLHSGYLDWTTNIGSGDEGQVVNYVKTLALLDRFFPWIEPELSGADRVHVWTPRDHFVRGLSDPPGWGGGLGVASVGDDSPNGNNTMDNPGFGPQNFVHEVSHNSGMRHVGAVDPCGSYDPGTDWPYSNQLIQEFGYDPDTGKIYNPSSSSDFMSYCYGPNTNAWISPFHWDQQFGVEGSGSASVLVKAPSSAVLAVSATLNNPDIGGDQGKLGTLYKSDSGNLVAAPAGNDYSVQLRNGTAVLASQPFGVSFQPVNGDPQPGVDIGGSNPPGPPQPLAQATVNFSMPWADGATSVVLLHGAQVLDTINVSPNPPSVQFTDPVHPATWDAHTTRTVSWAGSDPDGGNLTYSLFYSPDGHNYQVLATGLAATSYDVDVDSIAGGATARFRVVVSDGVNTASAVSATVTVPNEPPLVEITSPKDGTLVTQGSLLVLQGGATDLEDGPLSGGSLRWSSDRDGALGTGESLALNTLSAGLHTITLRATDSQGAFSEATVTVLVGVQATMDMNPDTISPGGPPPAVTATVTLPPGYPVDQIDTSSLRLHVGTSALAPTDAKSLGDTDQDGLPELALSFDGASVQGALPQPPGPAEVTLTGALKNGMALKGSAEIGLVLPGDADCNGAVDAVDALQVLRYAASIGSPAACIASADVNCDGTVNAVDALGILRFVAGLPPLSSLPGCPAIGGGASAAASQAPAGSSDGGLPRAVRDMAGNFWPGLAFVVPALILPARRRRR